MQGNPIWFNDPLGDKVTYENFKSRIKTFFAKFGNKSFRKNFSKFKEDKVNTFNIAYEGKSKEEDVLGWVTKGGDKNTFNIHWKTISKSDRKFSTGGSTKSSALYEEFYHVDD